MSSEIVPVLVGAIIAGCLQTVVGIFDRRREADSILVAICSEVAALCLLIRHRNYLSATQIIVEQIQQGVWQGTTLVIDIRSNYFSVFESLSSKIGCLKPKDIETIVNFYAYCKSAIDSTRPDGPMVSSTDLQGIAENIVSLEAILMLILQKGELIERLNKHRQPGAQK